MTNPIDTPELYDVITLAGRPSPGRARLNIAKRDYGWDEQKAKGNDGAETVKNGASLVKFTVELFLWRDAKRDCFAEWESWKAVLDTPVDPKSPKALDIYHPELDELGVRSAVVKARGPAHPDGAGGCTVSIDFLEYAPAKKAPGGKPGGSRSSTQISASDRTAADNLFAIGQWASTKWDEQSAAVQLNGPGWGASSGGATSKPADPNQDLKDQVADLTDTFQAA